MLGVLFSSRNVALIAISGFILSLALGFLGIYLPIKINRLGGPIIAGAVLFASNFDDFVMSFLGGLFADVFGRKRIILISTVFYVVGSLLLLLSIECSEPCALLLVCVASILLLGFTGISSGAISALIAESAPSTALGRAFAIIGALGRAASVLSPIILLSIHDWLGEETAALIIVVLTSASLVIRLGLKETLRSSASVSRRNLINFMFSAVRNVRGLKRGIIALTLLNGLGHGIFSYYYPVYLYERLNLRGSEIGTLYTLMALSQMILQLVAGKIADKLGYGFCLLIGNTVTGFLTLIFPFTPKALASTLLIMSGALATFHGVGYCVLITKYADEKYRATIYGALTSTWNIAFTVGPLLGGVLYTLNPAYPFVIGGLTLIMIVLLVSSLK